MSMWISALRARRQSLDRHHQRRGHKTTNPRRVFISGQKRGVFGLIKRELRRRSAIEPVIGHMKSDGHLGRCYLKGRDGDAANVVLSAVGQNLGLVLAWLRLLLRLLLIALLRLLAAGAALGNGSGLRVRAITRRQPQALAGPVILRRMSRIRQPS